MKPEFKGALWTIGILVGLFVIYQVLSAESIETGKRMDALVREANVKLTQMDARIKKLEAPAATPEAKK